MERLISRYSFLAWKYVHSFSRRFDGFKNSPLIDKDDLYQECITQMLDEFMASGLTADEFTYDGMKFFHTMHVYVKKCLPVKTTVRTTDFKKHVSEYSHTQNVDDVRNITYEQKEDELDFKIDCDRFEEKLPDVQRRMFRRIREGQPCRIILKDMGIAPGVYMWNRKKIADNYNRKNGTAHRYRYVLSKKKGA